MPNASRACAFLRGKQTSSWSTVVYRALFLQKNRNLVGIYLEILTKEYSTQCSYSIFNFPIRFSLFSRSVTALNGVASIFEPFKDTVPTALLMQCLRFGVRYPFDSVLVAVRSSGSLQYYVRYRTVCSVKHETL